MPEVIDVATGYRCADNMLNCKSIDEIKKAVTDFLAAIDNVSGAENGMYVFMLCNHLAKAYAEWSKQYSSRDKGSAWNVVIVPLKDAPIMLLPANVPLNARPIDLIPALEKFVLRCDEYTPPVCEPITLTEIKKVLTYAQKQYRLFDVIAPQDPLLILRLGYSHTKYNSQCLLPGGGGQASILSLHPNSTDIYDRVFVFAHELGHALHLSLTGNICILPNGFTEFNQKLGATFNTLEEQQEMFADSVALAILNTKGLGTHFPTDWAKQTSYSHARYLRNLCTDALRKIGALAEPLPTPNSPLDKMFREIAELRNTGNGVSDNT